jgi:histone H3/H4
MKSRDKRANTKKDMLSQKSFKSYIHRVLKSVHPDTNITKDAINSTDGILRVVATRVSNYAQLLTQGTEKKTLSAAEVQSAVRAVFPTELGKHAVNEGTAAVTKYTAALGEKTEGKDGKSQPQMRETRAGLQFSVSLAEKYIRGFGQIKYNIGAGAPVYLAAVLEYFTGDLMELAGGACKEAKRHNITVRHLFLAVNGDPELGSLLSDLNVRILGGGVMPNINDALLAPKNKKPIRRKKNDKDAKRAHRWRPGTVALREIKAHQKSDELLIQHAPFERVVRDISSNTSADLRFTHQFMVAFQNLIEHDVVNMLESANLLAIHAKRETVQPGDIELALTLRRLPNADTNAKDENSVPTAAINKLAYRAGIKRLGLDAKTRTQGFIRSAVAHYMHFVLVCAEHNKRRTINTKFLLEGLAMTNVSLATIPEKRRVRKKGVTPSRANSEDSVYDPAKGTVAEADEASSDEDVDEVVEKTKPKKTKAKAKKAKKTKAKAKKAPAKKRGRKAAKAVEELPDVEEESESESELSE